MELRKRILNGSHGAFVQSLFSGILGYNSRAGLRSVSTPPTPRPSRSHSRGRRVPIPCFMRLALGRARAVPQTRAGVTPHTPSKSENANGPTLECDEKWLLDQLEHLLPVFRAKDTVLVTADDLQQMTFLQENDPVFLDQINKFVVDFLKILVQHRLP